MYHFVMIKIKMLDCKELQSSIFLLHFRRKYITGEAYITVGQPMYFAAESL